MPSLSESDTEKRFGVKKAIEYFPENLTEQEEKNVKVVLDYMTVAYSPEQSSAAAAQPFCHKDSTFSAPSTFPTSKTPMEYADSHSKVMSSLKDLYIKQFDIVSAKEDFVSLRYTATGSHTGEDHGGIKATGKRAEWTAQGEFVLEDGLIKHWWKDWDKMRMWKGLGWVKPDNDAVEFA